MTQVFSRRNFLAATGAALAAPRALWSADAVPSSLDHIILGINDLDRGISFVEERTGVRAAFGGVHPGRGTQNALASLGEQRYLEIIAPDPKQSVPPQIPGLLELKEPRLVGWAVHTNDITSLAKKLTDAGVAIAEPRDGSRVRPDGRTLRWKSFSLKDDRRGLFPFFIEWSLDSVHPSADAPFGCRLVRFVAQSPDPNDFTRSLQALGVDLPVERGDKPGLVARIAGPRGQFELTS